MPLGVEKKTKRSAPPITHSGSLLDWQGQILPPDQSSWPLQGRRLRDLTHSHMQNAVAQPNPPMEMVAVQLTPPTVSAAVQPNQPMETAAVQPPTKVTTAEGTQTGKIWDPTFVTTRCYIVALPNKQQTL